MSGVHPGGAPVPRRVLAQGGFELRAVLRNGEQLLVTLVLPVLVLLGLTRGPVLELGTTGSRVDVATPGVLALAVLATAFTSQAIATAFDRRNGVLRMLATTPLGRGGLLAGKALAVVGIEAIQLTLVVLVAVVLGWQPRLTGVPVAALAGVLGTAALTALAMLLAGTLRSEGVLAVANLALVLLAVPAVVPARSLPGVLGPIGAATPSGALGEALRAALGDGRIAVGPVLALAGWTLLLGWSAARTFRWD